MLNYFNIKVRTLIVFIFSLSFIGFFILSSLLATQIFQKWYGFATGIALMIIAIPFHRLGKKMCWGYLASFLINSIASGFVVSAYYLNNELLLNIYHLLIGAIPAAAIIFLVYLMLQCFNRTKKMTLAVAAILNTFLTVTATVFWINQGNIIFSFAFFCSLISFFYLCVFGITINHYDRSLFRDISFGSFGSFIIISVVVAFILSEGEILDGLDLGGGEGGKKSRKK